MTDTPSYKIGGIAQSAFIILGGMALAAPALSAPNIGHRKPPARERRYEHQSPDSAPVTVLQRLLQAETSLAFEGTQVTTVSRNGLDISSEQHVLRNGDQALRIDYTRPERLAGESIVDNGKSYWHYRAKNNVLEVGDSRVQRLRKKIHSVIEQAKRGTLAIAVQGQDTIASRPCTIIDVRPTNGQLGPWRRLWVDAGTGAQLKIEQYDDMGQRRSASFFTAIAFNPAIASDAFNMPGLSRHPRVKQMENDKPVRTIAEAEAKAGFPAHQPTYLPVGFRFQAAAVGNFRGKKIIALRYNNGISVISLFQIPDDSGDAGPQFGSQIPGATTRTQGGRKLVLVGNLSSSDMNQIIVSVH